MRWRHRPAWHRSTFRYSYYTHIPYRHHVSHVRRYHARRDYYRTLRYRDIYWNTWVRTRINRSNGYYYYNGYPYFVYNGYLHRYSNYDRCDYELVDGFRNITRKTYSEVSCARSYDRCSAARDSLNDRMGEYRFFCSEKVDEFDTYDWNYNDDFYSDVASNTNDDFGNDNDWDYDNGDDWYDEFDDDDFYSDFDYNN